MKKTILSLSLAAVMLLSLFVFTACGSPLDGNDALAAMKYVDEQMASVKGFDVKATMTQDGVSTEMLMKLDISGEDKKMYMETEMETEMGDVGVKATVVDGTMYMIVSMAGVTLKQKTADADTINEMMGELDSVNSEYEYASAEFVSREDGKYVIKATLDEASAKEEIGEIEGVTLTDPKVTVTYECGKDGKVTKMTIDSSYKLDGESVSTKIEMVFTSLEIPTITAPEDADDYQDMVE